ncbi:hypothetical protein KCU78_g36, partial [Aureobasidium melanogenum]
MIVIHQSYEMIHMSHLRNILIIALVSLYVADNPSISISPTQSWIHRRQTTPIRLRILRNAFAHSCERRCLQLCVVRGIRHHDGYGKELSDVLPMSARALNARSIMSGRRTLGLASMILWRGISVTRMMSGCLLVCLRTGGILLRRYPWSIDYEEWPPINQSEDGREKEEELGSEFYSASHCSLNAFDISHFSLPHLQRTP